VGIAVVVGISVVLVLELLVLEAPVVLLAVLVGPLVAGVSGALCCAADDGLLHPDDPITSANATVNGSATVVARRRRVTTAGAS
jgi:predicted histidine transporter YuiF (NhaC family)